VHYDNVKFTKPILSYWNRMYL